MSSGSAEPADSGPVDADRPEASLAERFRYAVSLVESSPADAAERLERLQNDVAALGIIGDGGGETIAEDVATSTIPFLALEHHLALALNNLSTSPDRRFANLRRSVALWSACLRRLESLEHLTDEQTKAYHILLEHEDDSGDTGMMPPIPSLSRDAKIAAFKARKQLADDIARLASLQQRRTRLNISENEDFDGYDADGLERDLALRSLSLHVADALDQWSQTLREMPMLARMVQMQSKSESETKHKFGGDDRADARSNSNNYTHKAAKPMQLTHISKDGPSGELRIRREELKSGVFRPGWNQPTMSLEELGEREYHAAVEREARQQVAEAQRANDPQRFEYLQKSGLEDDADLVDASAKLDRDWDDFKDANPRGIGNKRGDQGDRNF